MSRYFTRFHEERDNQVSKHTHSSMPTSTAVVLVGDLRACLVRMLSSNGECTQGECAGPDRNYHKWRTAFIPMFRKCIPDVKSTFGKWHVYLSFIPKSK